jgi:hypothetical protein
MSGQVMARCGCGKRYPAGHGHGLNGRIVCGDCKRSAVDRAELNVRHRAVRQQPRRRGLFG